GGELELEAGGMPLVSRHVRRVGLQVLVFALERFRFLAQPFVLGGETLSHGSRVTPSAHGWELRIDLGAMTGLQVLKTGRWHLVLAFAAVVGVSAAGPAHGARGWGG